MKTENELFELLKDQHSLTPREEFVSATDHKLRQLAQKADRKSTYKRFSLIATGLVVCFMALSWIFLLGGHKTINLAISAAGQNTTPPPTASQQEEPLIYLYHTHSRESFTPEITVKEEMGISHESKNITLVGKRLQSALAKRNVQAVHDNTDFAEVLRDKGLSFKETYNVSRESLEKTLQKNSSIQIALDIHRDSIPRKDSTLLIGQKEYAKIAFVVSHASKYYEENAAFAERIHKKLEQKYPGISRGVIIKDNKPQSTYNQDIMSNSVLIEIGGIDNTLEEEYRTADILAEVLQEFIETN